MNESWEWFLNSQLINVILKVKENNTKTEWNSELWTKLKVYEKNMELKNYEF